MRRVLGGVGAEDQLVLRLGLIGLVGGWDRRGLADGRASAECGITRPVDADSILQLLAI
jgi:hypothetical protein